jgi:TetR/AcrR family transcriptional regulator, cholesterol catabolism regulator
MPRPTPRSNQTNGHNGAARPGRSQSSSASADSRFDQRLGEILVHATDVFCDKGYEGASMRDLSRASGMSLAGLYHYFGSKERLLYLIQKHTFSTIVEQLKSHLDGITDPEQRVRIFILNHLEYFMANQSGLKVLSHEDEALKNGFNSEIAAIKREYYRICLGLMDDLKHKRRLKFNSRTAVMSLFGMINWIYTWYNPRIDGTAKDLADQMTTIILSGVGYKLNPLSSGVRHPRSARVSSSGLGALRNRGRERARDLQFAGPVTKPAAKRRKNAAHGASRG